MKRFLLALALFTIVIWVLRRLAGLRDASPEARAARGTRRGPAGRSVGAVTELVRDRVCDTYVPKDRALTLDEGGRIHYFCSEPCRSRHVARAPRQVNVA